MGRPKALVPVDGVPMLQGAMAALAEVCSDVLVVSNDLRLIGVRVVPDGAPGLGPLEGIRAGLEASRTERCFVAACDMPWISPAVVRTLTSYEAEAVVPVDAEGRKQPLHACYTRSCLTAVRAKLEAGQRRADSFLDDV